MQLQTLGQRPSLSELSSIEDDLLICILKKKKKRSVDPLKEAGSPGKRPNSADFDFFFLSWPKVLLNSEHAPSVSHLKYKMPRSLAGCGYTHV